MSYYFTVIIENYINIIRFLIIVVKSYIMKEKDGAFYYSDAMIVENPDAISFIASGFSTIMASL